MDRIHDEVVLIGNLFQRPAHRGSFDIDRATALLTNEVVVGDVAMAGIVAQVEHPGPMTKVDVVQQPLLLEHIDAPIDGAGGDLRAPPGPIDQ